MNTRDLHRQRVTRGAERVERKGLVIGEQNDQQYQQDPKKTIDATAHTGEPARSFKMLRQHEEAARYRSQEMREHAERVRFLKEARLAQRMRQQTESSARRARRSLASLLLG